MNRKIIRKFFDIVYSSALSESLLVDSLNFFKAIEEFESTHKHLDILLGARIEPQS